MKLYFRNSNSKELKFVREVDSQQEVFDEIRRYAKENNIDVYYIRTFGTDKVTTYDFGSHSDFFELHK
jgi:hypothetical protein